MTVYYKPGTVAMVTALNRSEPYRASYDGNTWRELGGGGCFCVDRPTGIRPLVVLDLPNGAKAGWEVLIDALEAARVKTGYLMVFADLIEQIKAEVFPPKPDEPAGLGAVVEAVHDNRFVHVGDGQWERVGGGVPCAYDEIAVIRILSEGVGS